MKMLGAELLVTTATKMCEKNASNDSKQELKPPTICILLVRNAYNLHHQLHRRYIFKWFFQHVVFLLSLPMP